MMLHSTRSSWAGSRVPARQQCAGSRLARVSVRMGASATPPPPTPPKSDDGAKVDKIVEELKKTGMTASKAKEVLRTWASMGVNDPEALKKLVISKSLAPIPAIGLQALLDGVAAYGGFYLGGLAGSAENFPFRIGFEFLGYFFGLYYFVQLLLDTGVIGGLLYTTYRYGTRSDALLAAVQAMAGPSTGISLADKAAQAVNIFKVMAALETVALMLREEYKDTPKDNSMRNLGAYLTLSQAREKLGFKPENFGLTEKEAGNIAYAFAIYDINQDFRLEASELGSLCASLGSQLDEAESREAVKILDSNKDGYINFNEFVAWWVKKTGKTPEPQRVAQ